MTEVVSLRGDPLPSPDTADPDVVEILESWLQLARDGQITEISLACVYRDGEVRTAFAGAISPTVIGAASLLVYRLNQAFTPVSV